MAILHDDLLATRANVVTVRRRLDEGIERELQRGGTFGVSLNGHLWGLLNTLVERELQQPTPTSEDSLLAASTLGGPFRVVRFRRHLGTLIQLGYARRTPAALHPTIRGIGAVRPFSTVDVPHRLPVDKLRSLRQAELGVL
ncbi:MAG: hypothetical protein WA971_05640 [Microbacterium sp.]